ncbi:basic salivary proline-rich protein 2-like [Vombatus ursinus]|uniref:basic salivary proline-rich protein 2-like n=1 Tax=Vombatus ursinus TaxID=29139 RepID=UPI000FFDBED2|nr:basic salivary proline-rich protein 2-like [Vombatus ursinus]
MVPQPHTAPPPLQPANPPTPKKSRLYSEETQNHGPTNFPKHVKRAEVRGGSKTNSGAPIRGLVRIPTRPLTTPPLRLHNGVRARQPQRRPGVGCPPQLPGSWPDSPDASGGPTAPRPSLGSLGGRGGRSSPTHGVPPPPELRLLPFPHTPPRSVRCFEIPPSKSGWDTAAQWPGSGPREPPPTRAPIPEKPWATFQSWPEVGSASRVYREILPPRKRYNPLPSTPPTRVAGTLPGPRARKYRSRGIGVIAATPEKQGQG